MAGSHINKGNGNGNHSRGGGNKGYGLMLVLAFGAALLGVMLIHKLREKRLFNLLIKDKDQQLFSLQLLLQKEREYSTEMGRKTEGMKSKIYILRTHKMELERRILEMQSTIDSLNDEQKTMKSALLERYNEIKLLRETNRYMEKETHEMIVMTERLKQKEAEIEELKRRLDQSVKIWSVSEDDPSNPPFNKTDNGNTAYMDKVEVIPKKENGQLQELQNVMNSTRGSQIDIIATNFANGETAGVKREGESKERIFDSRNVTTEQTLQIQKYDREEARSGGVDEEETIGNNDQNGSIHTEDKGALKVVVKNHLGNATIVHKAGDASNTGEENSDSKSMNRDKNITQHKQLRIENSTHQFTSKGRLKMESVDDSTGAAGSRGKIKHDFGSIRKGKKWRMLARNRWLAKEIYENHEAKSLRNRKFPGGAQEGVIDKEHVSDSDQVTEVVNSKLLEPQHLESSEDLINKLAKDDSNKHNEISRSQTSHDREFSAGIDDKVVDTISISNA